MKYFHGAFGLVHVEHFHEAVAFRAMGGTVVHDFHVADSADPLEEILEIGFGDIVGQVADVDAGGFHAVAVATTAFGPTSAAAAAAAASASASVAITLAGAGGRGVGFGVTGTEVAGV